jgi:LysM repeat protein
LHEEPITSLSHHRPIEPVRTHLSTANDAAPGCLCRRRFVRRLAIWASGGALTPFLTRLAAHAADPDLHVVVSGDTLSEIAERYDVTVAQLRALNGIRSHIIRPGQRLRVRAGSEYPMLASVRSAISIGNLDRRRWKHIILHHSATAEGNAAIFDRYHRVQRHMVNGLAYHFIIGNGSDSPDGRIEIGDRWSRQIQGGHVRSLAYNDNSIGICMVGDFEKSRPTPKQLEAGLELVGFLKRTLLGDRPKVLLHRELRGEHTLCPGRHFPTTRFRRYRA